MTSPLTHLPGRQRAAEPENTFDRRLIAPMILGAVLNPVNSSMIAVALVPIGIAFGAPPAQTAWLVSALYLATAIGQPVVGRLVDSYGPRTLYLIGTSLVGIAGILGALAPSVGVLVVARVLLGFGTCAGYPAAMSLIRSEAARTGRDSPNGVLTLLAIASQTIAVIGPGLGGLLIGVSGWRTTFTVNIPLALACLVLGALRLPRTHGTAQARGARLASTVDLAGIVLFAATLVTLLLFLMTPRLSHTYLLAVAAASGAGLAWWELRAAHPFIDMRLLAGNLPLLATYGRTLLTAVVTYGFLYGYTQWLQEGRGLSPTVAGLVLIPMFAIGIVVAAATGRRTEVRGKLAVGAATQILACAGLLLLGPGSALWWLIGVGLVVGVPQGLVNLANQSAIYHQADPAHTGTTAGLYRMFFYLGAISAAAANGVFFSDRADTPGLHHLGLFIGGCAVLFLVLTVADRSLRRIGERDGATKPDTAPIIPAQRRHPMALTTLDERTALVLIDLQNGIVGLQTAPRSATDVVARSVELADAFHAHNLPVVLVRVSFADNGADVLPGRTEVSGGSGAWPAGWDVIVDDLAGHADDIIVTKRNWGAFHGTDLDVHLRRRGVTQIVLAGIATSVGVESTARAAHEHGYHVTLATDAMADRDADTHQHSVTKIFPRLGETGTTAEITELLTKTRDNDKN
ncbi:MAG TPA: MFS transporter [Pseudonocardia sp.]|nr:MFS transporter [Pseudonocardia sp.]